MPKIKVVVLLVRQLRHGFTKKVKLSPNVTVAQIAFSHLNVTLSRTFRDVTIPRDPGNS